MSETNADLGHDAPAPIPPPRLAAAASPRRCRPWLALAFIVALLSLPLTFRFDLGLGGVATLGLWATETIGAIGGTASVELIERIVSDPFKIFLTWLVIAMSLYGALQLAALGLDQILLADRHRRADKSGDVLRRLSGRPAARARPDYTNADAVETCAEACLAPIRLGVSLFPMLGFLGTVIGLSGAIKGLPDAITDKSKLEPVLASLHLAFDTTLIGLLGAILCLCCVRLAEGRIDAMPAPAP